jgi:hypothetical protein
MDWPTWELEFTPHLERRMEDRDFTEVDLPACSRRRADIANTLKSHEDTVLVVVTAYPLEETA